MTTINLVIDAGDKTALGKMGDGSVSRGTRNALRSQIDAFTLTDTIGGRAAPLAYALECVPGALAKAEATGDTDEYSAILFWSQRARMAADKINSGGDAATWATRSILDIPEGVKEEMRSGLRVLGALHGD